MLLIWFLVMFGSVAGRSDKCLDREPIRSTGFWASLVTRFTETDPLPLAPDDLDFVFIIIRRGMVPPQSTESNTYPKNWFYKEKWTPGRLTTDARRLMRKLGRSLYTRYEHNIGKWEDERIFASSSEDLATVPCGQEVVKGLFKSVKPTPRSPPFVKMDKTIDKDFVFFKTDSCHEYWKLKKEAENQWSSNTKQDSLYKYLRKKTGVMEDTSSEWYINSPERVYWLWEILDFERKSRLWNPVWYDSEMRHQIYEIVKDYYKTVMVSRWPMAIYVIGRLFQEMLDGFYEQNRQVHIHVTDDRSFAAFKAVLLTTPPSPPEVGETLLVEVDMNLITRVHSYRPYHSIFSEDLRFDRLRTTEHFHDLDDRINKRLCLPMSEILWKQRCDKSEFRLDLPFYFAFHLGCGPTWEAERRARAEENRRKQEAEGKPVLKRAYSGGHLPESTSFSSHRYPEAEYPTGGSRKDMRSPSLERAYSTGLPDASSPLYATTNAKSNLPRSLSDGRTNYGGGQGSTGSTPLQPPPWNPFDPYVPGTTSWSPHGG